MKQDFDSWKHPPKQFVCNRCEAVFLIGMQEDPKLYRPAYPDSSFPCPVCDAGVVDESET